MSNRKRMPSYRPWGSINDGAIEFESLTTETLGGALKVFREAFCQDESVSVGVDLISEPGAIEELEELCLDAARDGVSVVAIDVASRNVVGVAFNKIQLPVSSNEKSAFQIFSEKCKHKSSKALVDFMINVDSRKDIFGHCNAKCILEVMFLATSKDYREKRIGESLVSSTLELGRVLRKKPVKLAVEICGDNHITNGNCVPDVVSAIMTSNYSQKISNKLGFTFLLEVSYDDFAFRGKKFSERIGSVHKSCWLVYKSLNII